MAPNNDNLASDIERAVDEMFNMNERAKQSSVNCGGNAIEHKKNSMPGINIPSDILLILGLILILSNENNDKLLLIVMLYILI